MRSGDLSLCTWPPSAHHSPEGKGVLEARNAQPIDSAVKFWATPGPTLRWAAWTNSGLCENVRLENQRRLITDTTSDVDAI